MYFHPFRMQHVFIVVLPMCSIVFFPEPTRQAFVVLSVIFEGFLGHGQCFASVCTKGSCSKYQQAPQWKAMSTFLLNLEPKPIKLTTSSNP